MRFRTSNACHIDPFEISEISVIIETVEHGILREKNSPDVETIEWKFDQRFIVIYRRKRSYERVFRNFSVLSKFRQLSAGEIREQALVLSSTYPNDISDNFVEEIWHLKD